MADTIVELQREQTYRAITGNRDAKDVVAGLCNVANDNYWDVGAVLFYLKDKNIYKQDPKYAGEKHSKWRLYCENELPVGYRTAQYWIGIYEYFTDMEIDKERIVEIGWHKVKLLVNVTRNPIELESLLAAARTMSLEDLRATIAQYKVREGTDNRDIVTYRKFTFALPEAQGETIEMIFNTVKTMTDNSMNEALFKMCVEWWQENLPDLIASGKYVPPVEVEETVIEEPEEINTEAANDIVEDIFEEETEVVSLGTLTGRTQAAKPNLSNKPSGLSSFAGLAAEFPNEYGIEV